MQDLYDMMLRIHQLDRALLEQHDVTVQMLCLLWMLAQAPTAMTIGEVGDAYGRSPSSMTTQLDALEKRSLIARIRSANDRREVHIELTPRGMDVLQAALLMVNAALLTPAS